MKEIGNYEELRGTRLVQNEDTQCQIALDDSEKDFSRTTVAAVSTRFGGEVDKMIAASICEAWNEHGRLVAEVAALKAKVVAARKEAMKVIGECATAATMVDDESGICDARKRVANRILKHLGYDDGTEARP